MRTRLLASALLSAAISVTGCGDDEGVGGDGGTGCAGHLCDAPAGEPALSDPEGGNIIFEHIYFDTQLAAAFQLPQGITTATRSMAYFMTAQTPTGALPTPGQCSNLVTTSGWPLHIGTTTDVDVGTVTIKGKNTAGTETTITVPKQPAGTDAIGRAHNIFYQTVLPDADMYTKGGEYYDVTFGGAGSIPATTFDDALYMANHFTVSSPGLEDDGPLVAGTDYTVNWTPATNNNPDEEVLGITWLVDDTGSPTHICPTLHSAGTFTIPGSAITEFRQIATARGRSPDNMILLRNAIVHKLEHLPGAEPKRRIDMLSVYCWAQFMNTSAN